MSSRDPLESDKRIPPRPPLRTALAASENDRERRYQVVHLGSVVGYSNLEFPVQRGRRTAGFFLPSGDFDGLKKVFRLYSLAGRDHPNILRRYVAERESLALQILDSGQTPLEAEIELISPWHDGRFVIHVKTEDPRYWRRVT